MKILLFRKYAIKNNNGLVVKYFTISLESKKKYVLKLNNNKNHNQRYCCEVYHVFGLLALKIGLWGPNLYMWNSHQGSTHKSASVREQ